MKMNRLAPPLARCRYQAPPQVYPWVADIHWNVAMDPSKIPYWADQQPQHPKETGLISQVKEMKLQISNSAYYSLNYKNTISIK